MVAVIAVFGPTASGKTAVAEAVADRLGTEVVSCDAHAGLPRAADPDEPADAADRLVGIRALDEEMSVGAYATLAHARSTSSSNARGRAVVVRRHRALSACGARRPRRPAAAAAGVRERDLSRGRARPGGGPRRLAELDPRAAAAVHPNDRRRVVRALELAEAGASLVPEDDRLWASATRHETSIVGLEVPRDELERRIVARTDAMFDQGWSTEVQRSARAARVANGGEGLGLRRDRDAARGRGARAHHRPHPPLRRVPAEVDAADPGPR